jgi:hypothetical protein
VSISAAYWAGFFDGEGCITTQEGKAGFVCAHVSITQADRTPLLLAQGELGGYVAVNKRHGCGSARTWKWGSNKRDVVQQFLTVVRPYLLVKGPQVEVALQLLQLIGAPGQPAAYKQERLELAASLRELKKLPTPERGGSHF